MAEKFKGYLLAVGTVLAICGAPVPAAAKQSTVSNQPEDAPLYASVGDLLIRVTLRESLPNAFGGADIFGRKRERGTVEIRFMGMGADGRAIFRRKSTEVFSNETTLSPSQSWPRGATVSQSGSGTNVAVVGNSGGDATVQTLPGDTIEFSLDLTKHNLITVEDKAIEITGADPGGVNFIVRSRRK